LRPFRVATYAVYFVLISIFSVLVIVSVVRSVLAMTPPRQEPAAQPLAMTACVQSAGALWEELERARLDIINTHGDARQTDLRWMAFRTQWLQRFRALEGSCAVQARDRDTLKPLFRKLENVLDLYTTHAVQFAGEVGGAVESLRAELRKAASGT